MPTEPTRALQLASSSAGDDEKNTFTVQLCDEGSQGPLQPTACVRSHIVPVTSSVSGAPPAPGTTVAAPKAWLHVDVMFTTTRNVFMSRMR